MPRKVYKKLNYRRKRFIKRKFKRSLIPRGNPMKTAFPANRIVKLRYVENFLINVGAITPFVEYIFSANSIFDPNVTAAGHQPMGRDQWALFYKNYVVLKSKISVQAIIETSSVAAIFGVRTVDLPASGHTTLTGLMETPAVSYRYIQSAVNGNVPRPAVAHYDAKKWHNVQDVKDNTDRIGALVTANPTTQTYFSVFCGPHDTSTDIPSLNFIATIHYTVLFSDPRELAQS